MDQEQLVGCKAINFAKLWGDWYLIEYVSSTFGCCSGESGGFSGDPTPLTRDNRTASIGQGFEQLYELFVSPGSELGGAFPLHLVLDAFIEGVDDLRSKAVKAA